MLLHAYENGFGFLFLSINTTSPCGFRSVLTDRYVASFVAYDLRLAFGSINFRINTSLAAVVLHRKQYVSGATTPHRLRAHFNHLFVMCFFVCTFVWIWIWSFVFTFLHFWHFDQIVDGNASICNNLFGTESNRVYVQPKKNAHVSRSLRKAHKNVKHIIIQTI